jgi:hypothetical protein
MLKMITILLKALLATFALIVFTVLCATTRLPRPPVASPCSPDRFAYLDDHYFDISDGQGHGPDVGSNEWLHAFERGVGLTDIGDIPVQQQCQIIQSKIGKSRYLINEPLGLAIPL